MVDRDDDEQRECSRTHTHNIKNPGLNDGLFYHMSFVRIAKIDVNRAIAGSLAISVCASVLGLRWQYRERESRSSDDIDTATVKIRVLLCATHFNFLRARIERMLKPERMVNVRKMRTMGAISSVSLSKFVSHASSFNVGFQLARIVCVCFECTPFIVLRTWAILV